MLSKHLLLSLSPIQRKERRQEQDDALWKELNNVHHFEQNNWLKKRAKMEREDVPKELLSKYEEIYQAITMNKSGKMKLSELKEALRYSQIKITTKELKSDLKITDEDGVNYYIGFKQFSKWFYHFNKVNDDHPLETLTASMPSWKRQNYMKSIKMQYTMRDRHQAKLNSRFKYAVQKVITLNRASKLAPKRNISRFGFVRK